MEAYRPEYLDGQDPEYVLRIINPYADTVHGDWLERGKWCHTGEVYLDNVALTESETLEKVVLPERIRHCGLRRQRMILLISGPIL